MYTKELQYIRFSESGNS